MSKYITLPKMNTLGTITLVYDESSKIVRVVADKGTLDCAGNSLEVKYMDDAGKKKLS